MPPCTPESRAPRSPLLARAVLLAACTAGLTGLAVLPSGGAASASRVSLTTSVLPSQVPRAEPVAQHVPIVARASRSRPAAPKRVVTRPAPVTRRLKGWVRPVSAGVVSPFGPRWGRMHEGLDFGASYGDAIRAIGDGVVVGTGYQSDEGGYGQLTIIRHSNGFYSAYAHQSSYLVHVGQHVSAGELIGRVGATGHVTGPHLHFEIRTSEHSGKINPRTWLAAHGVSV